jgi:hypothetical protein
MPFDAMLPEPWCQEPCEPYFWREEHHGVYTVADLATIPTRTRPLPNQAEQDIITRDLLKQATGFPNLRPHV